MNGSNPSTGEGGSKEVDEEADSSELMGPSDAFQGYANIILLLLA